MPYCGGSAPVADPVSARSQACLASPTLALSDSVDGDEVDQLLDPAEQGRLEVVRRSAPAKDVLPGAGDVGLVAVRPAELLADALLPLDRCAGRRASASSPSRSGFTACPDVDERVADDQHVPADRATSRPPARSGSPWSRAPGGRRARRPGAPGRAGSRAAARRGRRRRRGTPRPRPRSAGRRPRPSRPARRRAGPRRRSGWPGRPGPWRRGRRPTRSAVRVGLAGAAAGRRREDHRPALEQEAGPEREGAPLAAPVLEGHRVEVALDGDDLAAPVGGDLLDDQRRCRPRSRRRGPSWASRQSASEDVGAVAIRAHRPR